MAVENIDLAGNENGRWIKNLVNYYQTSDERRAKYRICRSLGCSSYNAGRYRDWRWNKIARRFGYPNMVTMSQSLLLD